MGPLPLTEEGNKYVLVMCDHFTKYVVIFPLKSTTATDVANCFIQFISRHSISDTILSDQGINYQAVIISELFDLLDIHRVRTTPYHPVCDGLSERFNRTLKTMMAHYINAKQSDWDKFIPLLQFAYNTASHSTTKATPFELIYGRQPTVPLDLVFKQVECELYLDPNKYAADVKKSFQQAYAAVATNRDVLMKRNKLRCDRKVRACSLEIGDTVWLLNNETKTGVNKKLSNKWSGPYVILSKPSKVNYQIRKLDKQRGRKSVVHQSLLKRAFMSQEKLNSDQLIQQLIDNNKKAAEKMLKLPENLPDLDLFIFEEENNKIIKIDKQPEQPVQQQQVNSTHKNNTIVEEHKSQHKTKSITTNTSKTKSTARQVFEQIKQPIQNFINPRSLQAGSPPPSSATQLSFDLFSNKSDKDSGSVVSKDNTVVSSKSIAYAKHDPNFRPTAYYQQQIQHQYQNLKEKNQQQSVRPRRNRKAPEYFQAGQTKR